MTDIYPYQWALICPITPANSYGSAIILPRITVAMEPNYTAGQTIKGKLGDFMPGLLGGDGDELEFTTREPDYLHSITVVAETVPGDQTQYMVGVEQGTHQFLRRPENAHILATIQRLADDDTVFFPLPFEDEDDS